MYQFIHIETYARKASTKKRIADSAVKLKQNLDCIIAEAIREPGHCPHVAKPEEPRYLLGDAVSMQSMEADIENNLKEHHKKVGGKKVRCDAHVLLAGISSFPRELQIAEPDTYEKWEIKTLAFLKEKYGDDLKVVLMHNDEEHPHIHFYVYSSEKVNAKELHDGFKAAALKTTPKDSGTAYCEAMRDMQSDYYAKVGHDCGLMRDGPKRNRDTNAVYKSKQRENRERVALGKEVNQIHADLINDAAKEAKLAAELRRAAELQSARIMLESSELAVERATLVERSATMTRERVALDKEWQKAREAMASKQSMETELLLKLSAMEALKQGFTKRVQDFDAIESIANIVRKENMVGMLEFIDANPDVLQVLELMKAEPEMGKALSQQAYVYETMGNGVPVNWNSNDSKAAGNYLKSLDEPGLSNDSDELKLS